MGKTNEDDIRVRTFEVMQFEINSKTGESLNFNRDNIISALSHKSIKKWAYVCHDKDVYNQHDYDEYVKEHESEPKWHIGDKKGVHWHCVCYAPANISLEAVAKWFGVPKSRIDIPYGPNAFLDKVQYLTHEHYKQQELGKHRYDDDEIHSNFDFRHELNKRAERLQKFEGHILTDKDTLRYKVMYEGMSLDEAKEEDCITFMNDYDQLKKCRSYYLKQTKIPDLRINIYIHGMGGVGKTLMSKTLARMFATSMGLTDKGLEDDCYFEIGADKATFEGYENQPVIIWNDCRAKELKDVLGGKGNVFKVFDPHPGKNAQNIKYGSVILKNHINIVNSTDEFSDFINELCENEDRNQAYRRFLMFLVLHEKDYDLGVSNALIEDNKDFGTYTMLMSIKGNIQNLMKGIPSEKSELRENMIKQMCFPIQKQFDNYRENHKKHMENSNKTDEELIKEFKSYGSFEDVKRYNSIIGTYEVTEEEKNKYIEQNKSESQG